MTPFPHCHGTRSSCEQAGYCHRSRVHRQPECGAVRRFKVTFEVEIEAMVPRDAAHAAWVKLHNDFADKHSLIATVTSDDHVTAINLGDKDAN